MTDDVHARAQRLILRQWVEGISLEERAWLSRHLESCSVCDRLAGATDKALGSLRAVSVALPPALASRAQLRVYLRARQLQTREHGRWAFWISCGLSWALGIASAPYVWRGFEWLGHRAGLPDLIWQMGFGLWWAAPALVAAAILLIERGYVNRTEV